MINYYTIRIIISIIVISLIFCFSRRFAEKNKIRNGFAWFLILFFYFVIWNGYAYENVFLEFDTVETLFSYYFPNQIVLKKYEYEDCIYLVHQNKYLKKYDFSYVAKKGDSWMRDNQFIQSSIEVQVGYSVTVKSMNHENAFGIQIVYPKRMESNISISDSLFTNFEKIAEEEFYDVYIGIINQRPPKDYILKVGEEEHYLFSGTF